MAGNSLRNFLAITLVSIILLSRAWNWVGKGYISLLVQMVSPYVPANATAERRGHEIQVTVQGVFPVEGGVTVSINGRQGRDGG